MKPRFSRAQPHQQAGFTLLELLVALVIISLMTAVVGFSVSGNAQRQLKGEGDKLAARLNAAHAQMNAGASPIRLVTTQNTVNQNNGAQATVNGYAFEFTERANDGVAQSRWKPVEKDEVLAPRALPAGAVLQLKDPLLIAREPITAAVELRLVQGDVTVRVFTDGVTGWAAK